MPIGSAVYSPFGVLTEEIATCAISVGRIGIGVAVVKTTVCGSTALAVISTPPKYLVRVMQVSVSSSVRSSE